MSIPKPSSSRVSGLLQVIERSAGMGLDEKGLDNVSQATGKILRMLGQQEKTTSESILRKSKISQSLITLLLTTQDVSLHLNIIHILEHIAAASGNKATRLVRQGAPHALLRSIAATSRVRPLYEELCLHQHLLLIKLASKEKKLALKARLCGVVTVTLDLAKQCINNMDISAPLLQVLKIYASNSANAATLVKNGILALMDRFFSLYGKQNNAVFRYSLDLQSQILSFKANASKAACNGSTRKMLDLFVFWTELDKLHKYVHIRKSILSSLKCLVTTETGRKALTKQGGIQILYSSAKLNGDVDLDRTCSSFANLRIAQDLFSDTCPNSKAIDNLALTCSQIIRKSMPKSCLPIPSLHGPVYYEDAAIPNNEFAGQDCKDIEEEEPEECLELMPQTLLNIEDFLAFFPELTDYQDRTYLLESLAEYRKEYQALSPVTPSNSQNELSDTDTAGAVVTTGDGPPAGISVFVKPILRGSKGCEGTMKKDPSLMRQALRPKTTPDAPILASNYTPPPAKALKHFVKVPVPDMYSHRPPHYLEQLHDPVPSVQRTLMLLDIARAVHPETLINRTAYDQDDLLKSECRENHALSTVKWEPTLRRCKVLPTVPQRNLPGPGSGEAPNYCGNGVGGSTEEATVNIPMLHFESRFECGNLRKAVQVRIFEYDLILNSDIGSTRHHQWFYFEVKNMVADFPYRFNIINCEKSFSSFTQGMQPLLYSTQDALKNSSAWQRTGKRICYYKNNFVRRAAEDGNSGRSPGTAQTLYTLTFTICFPHSADSCYIAYHYPYSYTALQAHLLEVQHLHGVNTILRRQTLCHSLGGNPVDLLTITQFPSLYNKSAAAALHERDYVVLSARVHPGESNSSWIMRGVINFLLSDHEKAQVLRSKFIFKIVPMLNPDGVINGSHRCSLLGVDMNRQWINPQPHLFPSLHNTKGLVQVMVALGKRPVLYCDFHGHSRKKNVFMYGNITQPSHNATVKLLPTILDIHAPAFSFANCCFTVEKARESTARVTLWRQFGITRSYTLESSYCGADQGLYKGCQLGTQHLEEMGAKFCEGLLIMSSADQPCCLSDNSDEEDDSFFSTDSDATDDEDDSSA